MQTHIFSGFIDLRTQGMGCVVQFGFRSLSNFIQLDHDLFHCHACCLLPIASGQLVVAYDINKPITWRLVFPSPTQ